MKFFTSAYTEKNARHWAVQRELGRWQWVLLCGVCAFGGLSFMGKVAFHLAFSQDNYLDRLHLITSMAGSFVTGLFFGLWLWHSNEKSYTKYMNSQITQGSNNEETKYSSTQQL